MCKKLVFSISLVMLLGVAGSVQAEPVDPGTNGLVAYYALENDANDSSGNGLNGVVELVGAGAAPTFVTGPSGYGTAIDFLPASAGTVGSVINCGQNPLFDLTDAMTVGAWVNIRSIPDVWRGIITKGDSAWRLATNDTKTSFQFAWAGSARGWPGASSTTEIGFNSWHYICGTYDKTVGGSIYVDGVLEATNPDLAGVALDTFDVWIGGNTEDRGWKPYRLFDGQIDEVRLYNRALSVDEISFLMTPKPAGPKVIYVTSVKDQDQNGVQDDVSWKDWLEAEGYDVDFRPGYWNDPLDANEIAELNAADLIIASRGMATGDFDGAETPKWNGLTAPLICTNAWMIRNNRWKWLDSGTANKDAGAPLMMVTEPTHKIFQGLPVDADGLLDVLDPTVASGNTSFLTNHIDPGNGTMLSMSLGTYMTAWIVEWKAGVEFYPGAAEITGGKRILFMAGTQDDPYTVASGAIQPVGVFNLNATGQQLLRNIITYLLPKPPVADLVHEYTFEDGTANDSVGDADGTLVGGAAVVDGALLTTAQDQWMEMSGTAIAVNTFEAVTIACWYTPQANANTSWSMLAYFGDSVDGLGSNGFFITTARGDNKSRAAISIGDVATPWASESGADGPEYDDGLLHFMVSTISATDITLYIDGVLIATTPLSEANKLAGVSTNFAYLAKGGYSGDPEWIGQIQSFSMYNRAITADEVAQLFEEGAK